MVDKLTQEDFDGKVLDSNTAVVIDFWAPWCVPCRPVSALLEKLSKEYDGNVNFYKVNTDENPELTKKLKITDIPTILFFRNTNRIGIQRGAGTEDKIRGKIEALF